METKTCPECGVVFQHPKHLHNKRFCGDKCCYTFHRRNTAKKSHLITIGRFCRGCARDDSEVNFSFVTSKYCVTCENRGNKNGFCYCKAPKCIKRQHYVVMDGYRVEMPSRTYCRVCEFPKSDNQYEAHLFFGGARRTIFFSHNLHVLINGERTRLTSSRLWPTRLIVDLRDWVQVKVRAPLFVERQTELSVGAALEMSDYKIQNEMWDLAWALRTHQPQQITLDWWREYVFRGASSGRSLGRAWDRFKKRLRDLGVNAQPITTPGKNGVIGVDFDIESFLAEVDWFYERKDRLARFLENSQ